MAEQESKCFVHTDSLTLLLTSLWEEGKTVSHLTEEDRNPWRN